MVKINRDECIGCGLCAALCAEVFDMDDEMKAIIKSKKEAPCLQEAIDSCPTSAISK